MNILPDTHIALWAITDDPKLPDKAQEFIIDPDNILQFNFCLGSIIEA